MRAGLTWLTMEKHRQNLPKFQACAIVGRSKSPLDFNADPGPPNPSTSIVERPHPNAASQQSSILPEPLKSLRSIWPKFKGEGQRLSRRQSTDRDADEDSQSKRRPLRRALGSTPSDCRAGHDDPINVGSFFNQKHVRHGLSHKGWEPSCKRRNSRHHSNHNQLQPDKRDRPAPNVQRLDPFRGRASQIE